MSTRLHPAVASPSELTHRAPAVPLREASPRSRAKHDCGKTPHQTELTPYWRLELSRQVAVDLEANADLDERRSCPGHGSFLSWRPQRRRFATNARLHGRAPDTSNQVYSFYLWLRMSFHGSTERRLVNLLVKNVHAQNRAIWLLEVADHVRSHRRAIDRAVGDAVGWRENLLA